MTDRIPIIEHYRGVAIHDGQSRERIECVVKPAIDLVFAETDPQRLLAIASDIRQPPEARLFAAAKVEASFELAADNRVVRPDVDLTLLRASVAGLDSVVWRDPASYASLLDLPRPGLPGALPRETALDDGT